MNDAGGGSICHQRRVASFGRSANDGAKRHVERQSVDYLPQGRIFFFFPRKSEVSRLEREWQWTGCSPRISARVSFSRICSWAMIQHAVPMCSFTVYPVFPLIP